MTAPRIDWSATRHVLLDMDGTLLDLRFDNWFWRELVPTRWSERQGVSSAEAQRRLLPLFRSCEGTLDWYCLDHWSQRLGFDLLALKREHSQGIRVHPNAIRSIERIRALGKRTVLVTNAHHDTLALKLESTGIGVHFDAVFSSHGFGAPKERPEFWPRFAAEERFDPLTTLFVDDSEPVLKAARDYGIGTVVAVDRPDSSRPARGIEGFPAVSTLAELI